MTTKPTILFSGGGTLGPVTPLLAVWEEMQKLHPELHGVWVGTSYGPEKDVVGHSGMDFVEFNSPKLRRYFSVKTLALPFTLLAAIYRAMSLLYKHKPSMVVTAGGYTSVPVHIAAWLMRIPGFVHQQDMIPGLANKIMAPLAASVTCAFPKSAEQMKGEVLCVGNPVQASITSGDAQKAKQVFDLESDVPVVLVLGGGTGAQAINDEIWNALPQLTQHAQIIHSAGKGKGKNMQTNRYRQYPFISREDLAHAYAAADVVVARAGMGTLTEIAAMHKASVLVPIPNSHQEANAKQFVDAGAALSGSDDMIGQVLRLVQSEVQRKTCEENTKTVLRVDAAHRIAQMMMYAMRKPMQK